MGGVGTLWSAGAVGISSGEFGPEACPTCGHLVWFGLVDGIKKGIFVVRQVGGGRSWDIRFFLDFLLTKLQNNDVMRKER